MSQRYYSLFKKKIKKVNLTSKLSLLVILGVLSSVSVLGCYFDNFLEETFLEDAKSRILYGFQRLSTDLKTATNEIEEGIFFVQTDENFLASVGLINNYQDKKHYNAALLDEEKKIIAQQLLNRVKLSLNHFITLYDKNEELISFVEHRQDGYYLHFISYEDGHKSLYSRHENDTFFVKSPLPESLPVAFRHQVYYSSDSAKQGTITYHIYHGKILATSHVSIFDNAQGSMLMHLEMSHLFDDEYFKEISDDLGLIIRSSAEEKNASHAHLLTTIDDVRQLYVMQGERAYFSTARINIVSGEGDEYDNATSFYYHVALNKEKLVQTLAKNRRQFIIIIVFVTLLVLLILRIIFFKTLISPLDLLMEQIRKIEKQNYERSKLVQTGDELEEISKNINRLAETIQDREKALLSSQKELQHLSLHDTLTALPNRRLFHQRLLKAIRRARRNNSQLAVFFLDLDEFKQVNDTLGHDIGDQLLSEIALRLDENRAFKSHTIARLGGDEFTILAEHIENKNNVTTLADQLLDIFRSPFTCSGYELNTTVSVGVALFPNDGEDTVSLIKHADMAMYQAKAIGRNNFSFFSAKLAENVKNRIDKVNALKKAIGTFEEFYLLYQPKVCLRTGKVKSMEALVRWQSPTLGFVMPDQFIRLAEESNLIIPLGEWILEQACNDFMGFQQNGSPTKTICINVSGVQLVQGDIVETVQQAIDRTGIRPEQIELEITEGSLATKEEKGLDALARLREMHVDLAIDDFGTGYSSMSYLQQLPVTRLKIDKSFIDNLPNSEENEAIVQAIITLAKTFRLHITAEGVESATQLDILKRLGCDEVQGYFYSKPLSGEDFLKFSSTFTASDHRP